MFKQYIIKDTAEAGFVEAEFINDRDVVTSSFILESITPNRIKEDLRSKRNVSYKNCHIYGLYTRQDLAEFEDEISLSFTNCILEGIRFNDTREIKNKFNIYDCSLQNIEFINNCINSHFDIDKSVFYSDLSFESIEINSQFAISECTFMGDVLVVGAKGEGYFTWLGNQFYQQLRFWACHNKFVGLTGCNFYEKQIMLFDETCIDSVKITACEFDYSLNLLFSYFYSKFTFRDSYIDGRLIIYINERENSLKVNFSGLVASDGISVDWHRFIEYCDCSNENIEDEIGTLSILNKTFSDEGQYEAHDYTYFRMRRKMAIRDWKAISDMNIIIRLFVYIWRAMGFILNDFVGRYGTSFLSVLVSMLVTISLFAAGYYFSGLDVDQIGFINSESSLFIRMFGYLYYSSITFFTVGYGEITPDGIVSAGLAMLESFVGVFLMAYFVVAFTRKLTRQ